MPSNPSATPRGASKTFRYESHASKNSTGIRILIADDYPIFRDGLRRLMESEPDFRVVGEAGNNAQMVKLVRQLKPDILLLHLATPGHFGLEALEALANSTSRVRTVVLAAAMDREQILEALHLGARGIVLKESTTGLLHKSIRTVMAGQYWIGRRGVSDLVQALRDSLPSNGNGDQNVFGLTARELEIVAAIVAGYSNKDVAQSFSLSQQTVKHHLTNIFDKLGVSNRLELALFAVHHQLVTSSYTPNAGQQA